MGCGKARFGRKGQKTSNIENFGVKFVSLGPRGNPQPKPKRAFPHPITIQNMRFWL